MPSQPIMIAKKILFLIFSLSINEISNIFRKYNIISEFKVRKKYPASIDIELKKTNILAYYISDNKKVLVFDQDKNIAGIADIEVDFIISPKVVFNAIG